MQLMNVIMKCCFFYTLLHQVLQVSVHYFADWTLVYFRFNTMIAVHATLYNSVHVH